MVTVADLPESVRALYPFSPYTRRTGRGASMSYVDEGPRDAHAVLMLHGNPTWSFFYRNLVLALRDRSRCVVPDHIGMGLSEKPEGYDYRLAMRIADVEELVDALALTSVDLVVHDWGGAIGFGLATQRPELVRRIVILNTAAYVSDRIPARIALCRGNVSGKVLVRGLNGFAGPATWMAMHARRLSAVEKSGYLFPYDSWPHRVAVHEFVRDIPLEPTHPSRATLEKIEANLPRLRDRPKMILWGGKDFCFNEHFLARWREIYPEADVRRFAEAGHYVLDDAGDAALRDIGKFLG